MGKGHRDAVYCVSMDWPKQQAVSGGADAIMRVWDLKHGVQIRQLNGHVGIVKCIEVDWALQRVVSGGNDGTLRLWDLRSGDAVHMLQSHLEEVRALQVRVAQPATTRHTGGARSRNHHNHGRHHRRGAPGVFPSASATLTRY